MSTQRKWIIAAGIIALGAALVAWGLPAEYVVVGGLVLLCPLMMLFMGGHDRSGDAKLNQPGASSDPTRR